jgi:hypothetical protein
MLMKTSTIALSFLLILSACKYSKPQSVLLGDAGVFTPGGRGGSGVTLSNTLNRGLSALPSLMSISAGAENLVTQNFLEKKFPYFYTYFVQHIVPLNKAYASSLALPPLHSVMFGDWPMKLNFKNGLYEQIAGDDQPVCADLQGDVELGRWTCEGYSKTINSLAALDEFEMCIFKKINTANAQDESVKIVQNETSLSLSNFQDVDLIFSQQQVDHVVKSKLMNMGGEEMISGPTPGFFAHIHGKNSSPNAYKVAAYTCGMAPEPSGYNPGGSLSYPSNIKIYEINPTSRDYLIKDYSYFKKDGIDCGPEGDKCLAYKVSYIKAKLKKGTDETLVFDGESPRTVDEYRLEREINGSDVGSIKSRTLTLFEKVAGVDRLKLKSTGANIMAIGVNPPTALDSFLFTGNFSGADLASLRVNNNQIQRLTYFKNNSDTQGHYMERDIAVSGAGDVTFSNEVNWMGRSSRELSAIIGDRPLLSQPGDQNFLTVCSDEYNDDCFYDVEKSEITKAELDAIFAQYPCREDLDKVHPQVILEIDFSLLDPSSSDPNIVTQIMTQCMDINPFSGKSGGCGLRELSNTFSNGDGGMPGSDMRDYIDTSVSPPTFKSSISGMLKIDALLTATGPANHSQSCDYFATNRSQTVAFPFQRYYSVARGSDNDVQSYEICGNPEFNDWSDYCHSGELPVNQFCINRGAEINNNPWGCFDDIPQVTYTDSLQEMTNQFLQIPNTGTIAATKFGTGTCSMSPAVTGIAIHSETCDITITGEVSNSEFTVTISHTFGSETFSSSLKLKTAP